MPVQFILIKKDIKEISAKSLRKYLAVVPQEVMLFNGTIRENILFGNIEATEEAIIEAAKTRMTPVLLTTMAATIGLIPLAVGLNIDFVKLFTELNPHIYFGGDNVAFWGPLSWTMIFGLIFGTFLTLILVPVMYLLTTKLKERIFKKRNQAAPDVDGAVASI